MRSQVSETTLTGQPDPASLANQTLDAFLQRLGSSAPVPGGGAASAVAGALAASLVAMVAELSVGRPRYGPYLPTIELARAEGHRLAAALTKLADDDTAAFALVMAASGMPRTSDAEVAARRAALAAAAAAAVEPPRAIVVACAEIAAACERLAGRSNLGLASDLVVASRLVEGAAHGGVENVLVNLPSLGDPVRAAALEAEVRRVARSVSRRAATARAVVGRKALCDPEVAATGRRRRTTSAPAAAAPVATRTGGSR